MKTCIDCKQSKPLMDYHKKTTAKDGLQTRCKECNKIKAKIWQESNSNRHESYWKNRDSNREYVEKKYLKKKSKLYNIPEDKLVQMFEQADGKCNICNRESTRTLAVDHCHKTLVVRGLLCGNCNTALGLLQEDRNILLKCLEYLDKFDAPLV